MSDAVLKVRCSDTTARRMKVLAAELGCSLGELLKAFAFMVKTGQLTHGQLAQAHVQASFVPESGWVGDNTPEHRNYLSRVACLAREVGGLSTAASFERKCAHLMTPEACEMQATTYERAETARVEG